MKKATTKKILCVFLAALMLLSLTACGKDKDKNTDTGSKPIDLGDCKVLYKNACIMEDSNGDDAVVLTLDYTNDGKEESSYFWSVSELAMQDGVEMDSATIYIDYDTFETVSDVQYTNIAPGKTIEVKTAFVLNDPTSKIEVTFSQLIGSKSGKISIDPTTLSSGTAEKPGNKGGDAVKTGTEMKDWWNGDWYGWWKMTECAGYYEGMDGSCWDVCGSINISSDNTGTVTLWDEDYTKSSPMAEATVSLSDEYGEHGTMISESGRFTDIDLNAEDWVVNPSSMDFDDVICIGGYYENGEDEFYYEIYLRPWGTYWDDVDASSLPDYYDSWYLPLIEAGESMPDSIG